MSYVIMSYKTPVPIETFRDYYANIFHDKREYCTTEQHRIHNSVEGWFHSWSTRPFNFSIQPSRLNEQIYALQLNSTPGADGITAEHIRHGRSDILTDCIRKLFEAMIKWTTVPTQFLSGTIIPILKKNNLDPTQPSNYRPLTMTSVLAKLFELVTVTHAELSSAQFGFRTGLCTDMAGATINDAIRICNSKQTPVIGATLDAAKCFDSIWTQGLFYKLAGYLSRPLWCLYYFWYTHMCARIKLGHSVSESFPISRGVRQGSCASPVFFSIFIDNLLQQLNETRAGISIDHDLHIAAVGYADDVTLLSTNGSNMQQLLDMCEQYAASWRYRYNPEKSHAAIFGQWPYIEKPVLRLANHTLCYTDSVEVLGYTLCSDGKHTAHVNKRISKSRSAFYSSAPKGLNVLGLHPYVKADIFKSLCQSTLTYGLGSIHINDSQLKKLNTCQNNLIKSFMGLPKTSRSSGLLAALNIKTVQHLNCDKTLSLLHRTFLTHSILRDLCFYELSSHHAVPGTLVERALSTCGHQDLISIIHKVPPKLNISHTGLSDSIKHVLNNYILTPNSDGQLLLGLLTRSF